MDILFSFVNLNHIVNFEECNVHCSDDVKPECHLSAATVAEMTPFTDVPKSTPHIQLLASAHCALSRVSTIRVWSFVVKVALLKLILWHWVTTRGLRLKYVCTRCVKFSIEQKMRICTVPQLQILVLFPKHRTQYTSQFKMQIYVIHCAVDNALVQLRYLFDFTLFVFSH